MVLKHIFTLPTRGQIGLVFELQALKESKMEVGHPVCSSTQLSSTVVCSAQKTININDQNGIVQTPAGDYSLQLILVYSDCTLGKILLQNTTFFNYCDFQGGFVNCQLKEHFYD